MTSDSPEPRTDEHHRVLDEYEPGPPTEKPEITDAHRQQARQMHKAYEETRPTTIMPGTDRSVSGTAVNDWIDDAGNPKFSKDQKQQ
ncbi:hypothetical protein [Mycolicibacterium phlei]